MTFEIGFSVDLNDNDKPYAITTTSGFILPTYEHTLTFTTPCYNTSKRNYWNKKNKGNVIAVYRTS